MATAQNNSLTTPESNLLVVPSESVKEERKEQKRRFTEVDQKSKSYQV